MLHVPTVRCLIASSQSTPSAESLWWDLPDSELPNIALFKISTRVLLYYGYASAKLQLV